MDFSGLLAEDDLTELVDAEVPRVDLVDKAASGIPRFLLAKQAEGAGLLDPGYVRDLIKATDPEPDRRERETLPNGITVSGSPADIAAFIHKAAQRAEAADVAKEKNDTADRKHKAATGAAMPDGSYPIASVGDLDKAIHAVGRGGSSHAAIRRHIISRARSLGASSKIPDNWNSDGSLKGDVSKEAGVPDTVTKADVNPDLDDGKDGLDPTVPLAEPDEMGSGSPTDPGSPAWESVDAASAVKWTSILARARVAVDMLAEREMLEAAAGDDGDMCNAMDLQDVCCAIDYAIGVLAPFAVAEQSEADCGDMAMAKSVAPGYDGVVVTGLVQIAKALNDEALPGSLATLETYGAIVRKAGRVLSSVNEQRIRTAAASLTEVLSSLPAPVPDDGQPVAKMTPAEEADMPETTPSEQATAESGQAPAMGAREEPPAAQTAVITKEAQAAPEAPAPVLKAAVFDRAGRILGLVDPGAIHTDLTKVPVAKADGDKAPMMVVYNQAGDLVGIVSPDDITPVANSTADPDDAPEPAADPDGDGTAAAAPATDATDMTPAPPAETGTPSGGVDDVAKGANHLLSPEALESIIAKAVAAALGTATPAQDVAKSADVAAMAEEVETLKARLATVEETPAQPKVFTNGAVPPAHQMRGQDQGAAQPVDVAKALDLKREMYTADPARAKEIHDGLQLSAIDHLAAIQRR